MTPETLKILTYVGAVLLVLTAILIVLSGALIKKRAVGSAFTSTGVTAALIAANLQVQKAMDVDYWSSLAFLSVVIYAVGGVLIVIGAIAGFVRMKRDDAANEASEVAYGH